MRIRVIAVGTRMPRWVREVFTDYATRLGTRLKLRLTEIEPGARGARRATAQAVRTEGERLLRALHEDDYVVVLDERGRQLTTRELAAWLGTRMQAGSNVAILIGGPDGLAPEVLARGSFTLALSKLTLPHALVRVVLAEQLYRAHSVLQNHPYHRD